LQNLNLPSDLIGLTDADVKASYKLHGPNIQHRKIKSTWWSMLLAILREPMLVLLIIIAAIYFILGSLGEAYFMLAAIIVVSGISFTRIIEAGKPLKPLKN
jgi:Ca2+-transporting ATPase